ncbi:MAG: hypothetical protein WD359_02860 [Dehalococcoidia bacterium]
MGKRSDELQREIADYRQRLDARVNRIDERVRSDVRDSRETVDQDLRDRLHLDKYAEERPFLTLAAAFGAGILLGSTTPAVPTPSLPSFSGRDSQDGRGSRGGASGTGSMGFLASIVGSASGALSGTIEDEVRQLFSQVTGGREASRASTRGESSGSGRHVNRHEDAESSYDEQQELAISEELRPQ